MMYKTHLAVFLLWKGKYKAAQRIYAHFQTRTFTTHFLVAMGIPSTA